jgi:hypothetical protein
VWDENGDMKKMSDKVFLREIKRKTPENRAFLHFQLRTGRDSNNFIGLHYISSECTTGKGFQNFLKQAGAM